MQLGSIQYLRSQFKTIAIISDLHCNTDAS